MSQYALGENVLSLQLVHLELMPSCPSREFLFLILT